ncbi:MAG TPA: DUF2905 domain-containing protein [Geobacteraceae bacterium]|nr:DUF2905 domain-containing protein [Geobacteraceae bacterium]
MQPLGKSLIILGLVIAAVGVAITLAGKVDWLGRLPGDIHIRRENFSFHFPLTTCLLLSALISFILWLLRR